MSLINSALLGATIILLSACGSTTSYVDPTFGKASYDDIAPVATKYRVSLAVQYQKNGKPFAAGKQQARALVASTLTTTGVFDLVGDSSGSTLLVIVNNFTDKSSSVAKAFGTSLTFGAIGSTLTDYYEFTIEYVDANGEKLQVEYKHALHTTVGNKGAPVEDAEPTSTALGFATIVEQVMLNFVKDMQNSGSL